MQNKKTLILIPALAVIMAVSGCAKKETPKPVAKNANTQQVNSNVNENQGAGAVKDGKNGERGENKIVSNIKVVDMKNIGLIFTPWAKDGKSFLFRKYDTESCGHGICDYNLYGYNIEKGKFEIIESQGKNLENDWINSPSGKFAIKIISGSMEEPTDDLGVIYIKNLETNEIKTLGKQTYKSGYQDKYTFNSYNTPVWSPDDKWIAFYSGIEITVIRSSANNINEMKVLGETSFTETARDDEYYIYWSPDSTKLFIKDSYPIFSIDPISELYRPNMDKKWIGGGNPWRWSPDSKKILGIIRTSENLDFYIMDYDGNSKQTIISAEDTSDNNFLRLSADWSPDSKKIVYAYNQSIYILDTGTMSKTEIVERGKNYTNPNWSSDGKKIIYELNDQIWMITLE